MKKLKCIPGILKLDISPCPDDPKNCFTPELVRLQPYPGKYVFVIDMFNDGDEWVPGGPEMYQTSVAWCGKGLCFRVAVFNFFSPP
jgi:hypothetical protein